MSALVKLDENINVIQDIEQTQKICQTLMKTPHYAKMGDVGIYAIVQKARSMNMNPLEALNGGMYFVQGKVEMQGVSMLSIIRQHGHSVMVDPKSTNSQVIMHGKRRDNGDTWTVDFSIDDAKRAGIYKGPWEKYPKDMCMWRCVSKLGRFLFSDILKGVYVQGEISDAPPLDSHVSMQDRQDKVEVLEVQKVSKEDAEKLEAVIKECSSEYQTTIDKFLKKNKISSIFDLPIPTYEKINPAALKKRDEYKKEFLELKLELDASLDTENYEEE